MEIYSLKSLKAIFCQIGSDVNTLFNGKEQGRA